MPDNQLVDVQWLRVPFVIITSGTLHNLHLVILLIYSQEFTCWFTWNSDVVEHCFVSAWNVKNSVLSMLMLSYICVIVCGLFQ